MSDTKKIGITALRDKAKGLMKEINRAKLKAISSLAAEEARVAMVAARDAYGDVCRVEGEKAARDMQEQLDAIWPLILAYDEAQKSPEVEVPWHINDMIRRCGRGVDYGPKPLKVLWVSPSGRFFIVTRPGHAFWASMAEPSKYACSIHLLMDCAKAEDSRTEHGADVWRAIQLHEVEKRLKKATKEEWMAKAIAIEEAEPDGYVIPQKPEPKSTLRRELNGNLKGFNI